MEEEQKRKIRFTGLETGKNVFLEEPGKISKLTKFHLKEENPFSWEESVFDKNEKIDIFSGNKVLLKSIGK